MTVHVEYLFLVNGQDDDSDGFVDNGWDGVDNDQDGNIDIDPDVTTNYNATTTTSGPSPRSGWDRWRALCNR